MGHRVSLRWGRRILGPSRVIDTHAYQVGLSRKMSAFSDLLADMDRALVTTSLVVLQEETAEYFRLAARHPGRLYGVAYYDSRSPRQGLERLQSLCDGHSALILGVVTAFPYFRQDPRLKDFVPLYEYCMRRGF